MKVKNAAVKMAAILCLITVPFFGIGYAQDSNDDSLTSIIRNCPYNNFDEAVQNNERLRARYEVANPEGKEMIKERWEQMKQNRDGSGAGQKAQAKKRLQIHKDAGMGNGIGRGGVNGRGGANGSGGRGAGGRRGR
jgi:hypothetical protein